MNREREIKNKVMKNKLQRRWSKFHRKYLEKIKLRFVTWLFSKRKGKYCWADCVGWSYNPSRMNPFKIESSKGCEEESKTHSCHSCYCGGWNNGKCWDLLPKQEQEAYRLELMSMKWR